MALAVAWSGACAAAVLYLQVSAWVKSVTQVEDIAFFLYFLLILFLLRYPEWNPDSDSGHGM